MALERPTEGARENCFCFHTHSSSCLSCFKKGWNNQLSSYLTAKESSLAAEAILATPLAVSCPRVCDVLRRAVLRSQPRVPSGLAHTKSSASHESGPRRLDLGGAALRLCTDPKTQVRPCCTRVALPVPLGSDDETYFIVSEVQSAAY